MNRKVSLAIFLIVIVVSGAWLFQKTQRENQEDGKLKIAFIYVGPNSDMGWSYTHDLGRRKLNKDEDIETAFTENVVKLSKAKEEMRKYAEQEYDVIFNTAGKREATLDVAEDYPNTTFEHCTNDITAENVGSYYGRMYQPRYLTGIIAGMKTETDQIGYVAAHPIPQVIRAMDAFALGVKEANPDATVHVRWTGSWVANGLARSKAEELEKEENVDVIAQHQDTPAIVEYANNNDIYAIGYDSDMYPFGRNAYLTAPVWNWSKFYVPTVESIQNSTWEPDFYFKGLESGVVGLAPLRNVNETIKQKVEETKQEIIDGELKIFKGPIKARNGTVMIEEGKTPSDSYLMNEMDWLVPGIEGEMPEN